ncbi:MAG: phenylalanine--tRNA ligase subunit beta [Planctomycetota bacterium]|nr:phenylalanine--tRNA ligase subunit beta [Planctomycetota bacterium]
MHASVRWLNSLVRPLDAASHPLTSQAIQAALMGAGFPIESVQPLPDGDELLDVEVTSNRGDVLSHVGMAREIAAKCGLALVHPASAVDLPPEHDPIQSSVRLDNRQPDVCPLFTLRVIRGVRVGPSPDWLVRALASVGQRSINNVVDVTNYINFELGHPSHVFDLAKLAGRELIVRYATQGESLLTLDGRKRVLASDELVVADAERAQSLAGVIGGGESEVGPDTVDIALEVATWDPVTIRRAARRHQIRTDASHRFERWVDAHGLESASRRAAALMVQVAGGKLQKGVLTEGRPLAEPLHVTLRPERCAAMLGLESDSGLRPDLVRSLTPERIASTLEKLEFRAMGTGIAGGVVFRVPTFRPDIKREIDLIEEVGRTLGLDAVPTRERISIRVQPAQEREKRVRTLAATLTSLGFYETVTFSFLTPEQGQAALGELAPPASLPGSATTPPAGQVPSIVNVDDERRGGEPTLRPSLLPSLIACRKVNQDGQVRTPAGVRLFEIASTFAQVLEAPGSTKPGLTIERPRLALLADVPGNPDSPKRTTDEKRLGVRLMRGVVESCVRAIAGEARLVVERCSPGSSFWEPGALARCLVASPASSGSKPSAAGTTLGVFGLISTASLAGAGLEIPVVAAELDLMSLLELGVVRKPISTLPAFPSIERDVSFVLPEATPWANVHATLAGAPAPQLEDIEFVGVFRGKQIGPGKKSVTVRFRFRDPSRTLRHEEIDPAVENMVGAMRANLSAEVRSA